jgi:hypothetical protein
MHANAAKIKDYKFDKDNIKQEYNIEGSLTQLLLEGD